MDLPQRVPSASLSRIGTSAFELDSKTHYTCGLVLHSQTFEHLIGTIIFFNFIVVIRETDIGATGEDSPFWLVLIGWILLGCFVFELLLKLFVLRRHFTQDSWNIFDFFVISIDLVMGIISIMKKDFVDVSALRILRLSRLARATKVLRVFPELQLMVAGLAGAVQAIFWGTILIVISVLVWSILAVQFINDLNQNVANDESDPYNGCPRCRHAYDSVFHSAVTFTTQIVAGDSWGRETVPIVEKYPYTLFFFSGVFLTIGLAILNLILGVVVNVATDARDGLQKQLEADRMIERSQNQKSLLKLCRSMDKDGNDELNKEELVKGFDENQEFREMLLALDIQREDLEIVWSVLDADKSGTITSKEFVSQINSLKHTDVNYMLAYIKFYITDIKEKMESSMKEVAARVDADTEAILEVEGMTKSAAAARISQRRNSEPTLSSLQVLSNSPLSLKSEDNRASSEIGKEYAAVSPDLIFTSIPEKIDESVSLKSMDILLESALMLAQMQNTWQQMILPINDMQDRHVKLANDLKAMAPIEEPLELLSRVQSVWNTGLTCIQNMRESHTQLSDELANIAPIRTPSALIPQLQDACQNCLTSSSMMLNRHSELCGKIETMIKQVNLSLQENSSKSPPPFK